MDIPATRTEGLRRLSAFVPRAGRDYARLRNHDLPGHPHVSTLSPFLRHRLLTEAEVLEAVLARHSLDAAGKFVAEVFWRTYWKGWLELRPEVWAEYRRGLAAALNRVQTESGLRRDWQAACRGETGIDGFDHWARDLAATGYLHNHARMWFASIWIFTLRLPWELGADFFLRHLLDGDPATNTLSWRWVGGLQTVGKTYLARPDNIEKFTGGRFRPQGLAPRADPLPAQPLPAPRPAPQPQHWDQTVRTGLLLTEEDLSPGYILSGGLSPVATATLSAAAGRSPLAVAPMVHGFTDAALADCTARWAGRLGPLTACADAAAVADWARANALRQIVTPYAPTGPAASALDDLRAALWPDGIALIPALRPFDAAAWPHATQGFFRFRDRIPSLVAQLRGVTVA